MDPLDRPEAMYAEKILEEHYMRDQEERLAAIAEIQQEALDEFEEL